MFIIRIVLSRYVHLMSNYNVSQLLSEYITRIVGEPKPGFLLVTAGGVTLILIPDL